MYERLRYIITNVSHARGNHMGYDLYLEKDDHTLRVEVKGCSKLYQIPDLYATEIDRDTLQLVADELCVVYLVGDAPVQIARIPREALQPEHIIPKYGYRISGRFKNERTIKPYLIQK
ncbi:hypothetical protein [Granulicella paludicola]|uniref:hypothetical protein n=1 Tax=Granulicella paludicola TaxID=474951 RepID=UPI0021E08FC3|nr:hypothetical protein [Granulicella paludicola]